MANRHDNFADVYKAVIRNAKVAAVSAAKQTAQKIARDMHKEALDGLEIYYQNYDPDVYDRTYNLKNAIRQHYNDKSTKNNVNIEIGIIYDASYLEAYRSNSPLHQSGNEWISRTSDNFDWDSSNNGTPDPEWILNNFLHGVHPRTTTGYAYSPIKDSVDQIGIMNRFIDKKVQKIMDRYMNQALIREFTKRMR